jgi:uncharacterized protein (DUF302 family)
MIDYGFTKEFDIPFEDAIELATSRLKIEGFGILTKIDIKQKLKEKLGIDFRKYVILGACHPASAHKAILAEPDIGLMLPCNVIVYEKDDKTVVSIVKPSVAMQMINNDELLEIAKSVEKKLNNVMTSISKKETIK